MFSRFLSLSDTWKRSVFYHYGYIIEEKLYLKNNVLKVLYSAQRGKNAQF